MSNLYVNSVQKCDKSNYLFKASPTLQIFGLELLTVCSKKIFLFIQVEIKLI